MNMMHCAAMNNHTDIVEYIVNDLQMGELDKEDIVRKKYYSFLYIIKRTTGIPISGPMLKK